MTVCGALLKKLFVFSVLKEKGLAKVLGLPIETSDEVFVIILLALFCFA